MAVSTTTLDPFKRGDTPTFLFAFSAPTVGFDWTGITLDAAMTDVEAPSDNTGAAAVRLNQTLTADGSGGVTYSFTLTISESNALTVDANYKIEAQLKQGGVSVVTPVTAQVKVLQDYVL